MPGDEGIILEGFGQTGYRLLLALILLSAACAAPAERPEETRPVTSVATATVTGEGRAEPTRPAGASEVYTAGRYRLKAGELLLAADADAIPAIFADDTLFVGAEAGSREWAEEDLVIGVAIEGEARAYPVRLLSSHEIVNDRVGGQPIAVTWCPLCFSALVFERDLGRELTFGVSGYLLHNNLVMYDHQTNTLWSQMLAQGIRGAMRGERLTSVPAHMMTWGSWKARHPQTRVLSATRLGKRVDEVVDPYAGYYSSGVVGVAGSTTDERLPPKALVVGLVAGGTARAYPLSLLQEGAVINDTIGTVPVLLVYASELDTTLVYSRVVDGEVLTFRAAEGVGLLQDGESGSLWEAGRGRALDGHYQGRSLDLLAAPLVYWFAWSALYPDTALFPD